MKKNLEFATFYKGSNKKAVLIIHGFTGNIHELDIFYNYFKVKNFTVIRPILAGHHDDAKNIDKYGPDQWMEEVRGTLKQMPEEIEEVFIIGISFGGNLALCLGAEENSKIKAIILVETPIFFKPRFRFLIRFVLPIFVRIGITKINKTNKFFYRKNYQPTDDQFDVPYLPLITIGRLFKFINTKTIKCLPNVKQPCFIINAEESDLLSKNNFKFIYRRMGSKIKKRYIVPIDNHDLDLLDEPGKISLVEKVYKFIKEIK